MVGMYIFICFICALLKVHCASFKTDEPPVILADLQRLKFLFFIHAC